MSDQQCKRKKLIKPYKNPTEKYLCQLGRKSQQTQSNSTLFFFLQFPSGDAWKLDIALKLEEL